MAKRKSSFEKRMNKIQGLSKEEKLTFVRLGEIIDGAVNNRGPTNPGQEQAKRIGKRKRLPPPGVINVELGVRTAILSWAAVDGSLLLHYRIVIQNMDTGQKFEYTSYTNRFNFKGQDAGRYRCYVQSIGRGGIASVSSGKDFTIPDNDLSLAESHGALGRVSPRLVELRQDNVDASTWTVTLDTADGPGQTTPRSTSVLSMAFGTNNSMIRQAVPQSDIIPAQYMRIQIENNEINVAGTVVAARIYFNVQEGQFELITTESI